MPGAIDTPPEHCSHSGRGFSGQLPNNSMTKARLTIVYVWDADYPWDVRVEKTCRALVEAGHEVHIVARNRKRSPATESMPEGTVHRMQPWRWAGRTLDSILGFPAFFSPRWSSFIAATIKAVSADLVIVRDLPLCPTAIRVGRSAGIPIMLDMAENYPAMMRDIRSARRRSATDLVVRNPIAVEWVERYCINRVDHILTVVDESSARLTALGISAERMSVVSNTPPSQRVAETRAKGQSLPGKPIEIVYLGLLEIPRGIGELIDALVLLRRRSGIPFHARIIGDGRDAHIFRQQADRAGLGSADIDFLGRLPHSEALSVVASSDIGVIPHHANECWNSTIPNKLFDYMAAGLPVVSSDAAPCERVLRDTGAGCVFASGDPGSLASGLESFSDVAARRSAGSLGRSAILERYNWESDTKILLNAIAQTLHRTALGADSRGRYPYTHLIV